jgi:hypothetical protein
MTLHEKPPNATHWSMRSMARAAGISYSDGALAEIKGAILAKLRLAIGPARPERGDSC